MRITGYDKERRLRFVENFRRVSTSRVHFSLIDQAFIREAYFNTDDKAIVSTIIAMAKKLSMTTVADGMENSDIWAFLEEEELPSNDKKEICQIPLNVTYDFGQNLMVLRPRRKKADGKEYDFKRDAAVPLFGDVPEKLKEKTVLNKAPYRIPQAHQEQLCVAIKEMLDAGVISRSKSVFNSTLIIVPKPGSVKVRVSLDLRGLNDVTAP